MYLVPTVCTRQRSTTPAWPTISLNSPEDEGFQTHSQWVGEGDNDMAIIPSVQLLVPGLEMKTI